MDNKIKAFFKTIFSVNFLLKILLITAIILMLQFIDEHHGNGSIGINIYHRGDVDVSLKNAYRNEVFNIRQFNVPSR